MQGLKRTVALSFDETLTRVPAALAAEGFGVLTQIDLTRTLKEKIGADVRRYHIFGACNPPLAHRAVSAEVDAGLMLPCNVIVYVDDDGRTIVNAIDPLQTLAAGHPSLRPIAEEVRAKLSRVVDSLPR